MNEYSSLKDGVLYSWGELSPGSFFLRLGGLWLVAFTILGVPIAAASFNPSREPLRFALAAGTGTLFLVSLIVLRIYLVTSPSLSHGSFADCCGVFVQYRLNNVFPYTFAENPIKLSL